MHPHGNSLLAFKEGTVFRGAKHCQRQLKKESRIQVYFRVKVPDPNKQPCFQQVSSSQ